MTEQIKGYNSNPLRAQGPGRRFNMEYGFVRGKSVTKGEDIPLITSRNGYNCYLLIASKYSRHLWIFLFAKKPPVVTVTEFLSSHGAKHGLRWIRTDQGGELAGSAVFRKCVKDVGFILKTTGAGTSLQNAIVERPYRTLASMMRTMLSGANFDSSYWSFAIQHAVYIKNRLPHQALPGHITPFERFTGRRSDLSHIWVFSSHVMVK